MPDDRRPVGKIPLQRKLVPRQVAAAAAPESPGVPAVDLRAAVIELAGLEAVPREVAEALLILPVTVRGDRIFLAMADPSNRRAIDEVEFVTGKAVQPWVAPRELLAATIAAAYDAKARGEPRWAGPDVDDVPSGIR
jgi:hypothetical protein